MTRNVFIALQMNEEARPIVDAIVQDNPDCTVSTYPAMVKIDAPGRLTIKRDTVSDKLGRQWDVQELHINLLSLGGNIDETDDYFAVAWA